MRGSTAAGWICAAVSRERGRELRSRMCGVRAATHPRERLDRLDLEGDRRQAARQGRAGRRRRQRRRRRRRRGRRVRERADLVLGAAHGAVARVLREPLLAAAHQPDAAEGRLAVALGVGDRRVARPARLPRDRARRQHLARRVAQLPLVLQEGLDRVVVGVVLVPRVRVELRERRERVQEHDGHRWRAAWLATGGLNLEN